MPKSTDIKLQDVQCSVERIDYRTPIKFGGRVVVDAAIVNVTATVETRDGRQGQGFGSMPMGNVWAWPTDRTSGDQTLRVMIDTAERLVKQAADNCDAGHPLEMTDQLSELYAPTAEAAVSRALIEEPMPRLAQLVAASPLEAAIHDAYGKALGENSYNLLGPEHVNADLSAFLNKEFAGEHLDRYTLRDPKLRMPLYHLVGALDPLTDADLQQRINDGLPETLGEWILADGLTHLKIKLAGDNLSWDVERVVGVENAASAAQQSRGCEQWHYSLDFNEKCPHVEYILDFLAQLKEKSPAAWDRVQYLEQPTHRDLRANPENRMHEAARIKPVVIDESLIDFESLLLAREQGYSGVALKACKGHSEALLMGAAAQKYNLFLCVQDLTCVGASFLHSASLAARIPTIAAIEGNGRQYCPAGNEPWRDRFPGMFDITDGAVATGELVQVGLGY